MARKASSLPMPILRAKKPPSKWSSRAILRIAMPAFLPACLLYSQTIDQYLAAPFPSDLVTASNKVAWVSNLRGVRNVMVAEPPQYRARAVTAYTADDGQELTELRWTPDASALVFTRGGELNPTHAPKGVEEAIYVVTLNGGSPRKLAE